MRIETVKNIWFNLHSIGMYTLPFIWPFFPKIIWIYLIIILSWYINNNKCIISEIEYHIFGETFFGKGKKYFVPKPHRYILYASFALNFCYIILKQH
tara:strand:+ start:1598 stop:1888 length:291 start_codon:yes stop_codon:yes gene_type:complete